MSGSYPLLSQIHVPVTAETLSLVAYGVGCALLILILLF